MKKIILFVCMSGLLLAGTKSDIAFTAGYNKFDDPQFLRKGHMAYGIRGGIYKDNGLGYQLGFEHISNANCKGLKLNRIYANALMMSPEQAKLKPYGLVTAGYETSNIHAHKPSQLFVGAGVGVRYEVTPNVNAFVETRILQKLKSHDSDIVTTMGIAYALDHTVSAYAETMPTLPRVVTQPRSVVSSSRRVLDSGYTTPSKPVHVRRYVQPSSSQVYVEQPAKNYYVQLAALSQSSSADPFLNKLYSKGVTNIQVQQVYRNSREVSIVVVGPYKSRNAARRNLKRFKRFSRGAFVTKL